MTWRRPQPVDVALATFTVLTAWAAMAARLEPEARPVDAAAYVLIIALGIPMLVRRSWPVAALLVTVVVLLTYYGMGYSAVGLAVPIAPALFSVAEAGRWKVAALVGGALLMCATGWRVYGDRTEDVSLVVGYDLASSAALMAAVIAFGDALRSRRGWQAELRRRVLAAEEDREREAHRRVAEERLRVARDVHDLLGHTAAVLSIQADVAVEALDDDIESTRRALGTIREVSRRALRDLRDTVGLLRTDVASESTAPVAGIEDLPRLIAATTTDRLQVRLQVEGTPRPLPSTVSATVYRIVQESLTNVVRHADAANAVVRVRYEPANVYVNVIDDGHGSHAHPTGGHGLRGMRERVALLGGDIGSANHATGGFEVTAVLPTEVAILPTQLVQP